MISMDQLIKSLTSCSLKPSSTNKSTSVYNLLLLGQSGVGKSTFINALHNYLTYKNINDIQDVSQVQAPVPIAFEMCDDNDIVQGFKVGEEKNADENENLSLDSGSGTRGCKSYRYQFDDISICLIDTPGLVDTEGVDKDKENMEHILSFIGKYKNIHGICILLKPDEERLNDVFKYCIQELLGQLHHAAAANIIWMFTKAASNCYKIGSTGRAIQIMIKEIHEKKPELHIPFRKANYFFFDSVSFLYLVAKDRIKFNDDDVQSYKDSWNRSRREFERMMHYVICIPPYDVRMSLSIHRVRELIDHLSPQLQKITNNIIEKQIIYLQKESDVVNFEGKIEELQKILFIETTELETTHYDAPRFVCKSVVCRKEIIVDGEVQYSYPQVCCALGTSIKEIVKDIFTNSRENLPPGLIEYLTTGLGSVLLVTSEFPASLVAFTIVTLAQGASWYLTGKCIQCSCLNKEHSITYYEVHDVIVRKEDPITKEELLKKNNDIAKTKDAFIKFIESELQPIHQEMEVVSKACQMFAVFLKQTAIVPYNDAFPGYLKMLIQNSYGEKKERLKEHLKMYTERIDFIEKNSINEFSQKNIEPQLIDKIVEELKDLPIYGSGIKTAIDAMKKIPIICDHPGWDQYDIYNVHDQYF